MRAAIATRKLVVATDLDGTFLAGSSADRAELYSWLQQTHGIVGLIFVTGRSFDAVAPLFEDPAIPVPDLVIADVGSSVGAGVPLTPIPAIEARLRGSWPGRDAVRNLFADLPSLEEQTVPQRGRVSYLVTDASVVDLCRTRAARHGLNVVYSCGRYLDVLPAALDKGRALLAVMDHFAIRPERVLVCGDTLNDLSLFGIGLRGVAVGGSEPALLAATRGNARVHHARAPGAGGIMEAILHFFEPHVVPRPFAGGLTP